jgi:hypothetical protein
MYLRDEYYHCFVPSWILLPAAPGVLPFYHFGRAFSWSDNILAVFPIASPKQ